MNDIHYAGFWSRTLAALIDTALVSAILYPLLTLIYGSAYWSSEAMFEGTLDALLNLVFPALAVILFWVYKSATPGKMVLKLRIVDAKSLGPASTGQLVLRYFAYYLSLFPLGLGIIWVALDKRKQGWHDKLAGTLVVKEH